jgi:predicted SAM-dependent methyltransferase
MAKETSKCYPRRHERGDFKRYLIGEGIDIGAGDDSLVVEEGSVRAWDKGDGDAMLMAGVEDGCYDFVYSSHCLEHLVDVKTALANWARILKTGGVLYVVVPDFELYEKSCWPSRFNGEHKASFSLYRNGEESRRKTHYLMSDLVKWMDRGLGLSILEMSLEDAGFDYARFDVDQTEARNGGALSQIYFVGYKRQNGYPGQHDQGESRGEPRPVNSPGAGGAS